MRRFSLAEAGLSLWTGRHGSDSTYYYVTSSQEAACEAAGIELSELTNMMQFTDEGYIRSYLEHFLGRFPKIDLWISLSAAKE